MGPATRLDESTIESLTDRVHGDVLRPSDEGYDAARTVWNAKVDKEPAVIVRCTGTADVMAAVDVAREQDLPVAVKGGGHDVAGYAVCDDGLVIDLAPMNGVRVDPDARTVRVQGGATWGDINHELRTHGLEIVGNPYDEVGVGGYTLGGGMGLLSRKYGLAIDNLRAVDVVTAEGALVHASDDENPELFWALRGGGGNFGVVTSFEFDCHEVRPEALHGQFLHPIEDAADVLSFYREFMADAPTEVVATAKIFAIPADPAYPAALRGEPAVVLDGYHFGDLETGEHALQPFRDFGDPIRESVERKPYSELGTPAAAEKRNHWKNHYFSGISDAAIDTVVEKAVPLPGELMGGLGFFSLGGAINGVDADATAYPHREATHLLEIVAQWSDPDDDEAVISWVREVHAALAPYATGGEYVNNQTDDDAERVTAAYGDNYDRLVAVKTDWDPQNLFHMNQNIEPTG